MRTYIRLVQIESAKALRDDRVTTMSLMKSFSRWRQYRQTCNELNRMTERELYDLGISRGDIPYVARGGSRN